METIYKTWIEIKNILASTDLILKYEENDSDYYIWIVDGEKEYHTSILKNSGDSDYDEFLSVYKCCSNQEKQKTKTISSQVTITGVNQNILEYTVPTGKMFYITNVIVGGTAIDLKILKIGSYVKIRGHHLANTTIPCPLSSYIKVQSGENVYIENIIATSGIHTATIIGVLYNV